MSSTYPFAARCSRRASLVERHRRLLRWWREQEAAEARIVASLSRRLHESVRQLRALSGEVEPGQALPVATDGARAVVDDERSEELGARLLDLHRRLEHARGLLDVARREVAGAARAVEHAELSLQRAVRDRDAWRASRESEEGSRELERSVVFAASPADRRVA